MENQLNYLEEYCKESETQLINKRLLTLYKQWYKTWYEKKEHNYADLFLNRPFLLTCTDEYLHKKVMLFGKEAHDIYSHLNEFEKELDDFFVSGSYYYEKMIRYDESGINREFLKTRKVCAGLDPDTSFKDNEPQYRCFTSVLVNNLNKVSFGGKPTPVDNRLNDIYAPFEYEGNWGNIYFHEIRILKPERLVFATGNNYMNHLERDFGKEVADELKRSWKTLYLGKNGEHKTISEVGEIEFAGEKMKYIYGYHPNAHLTIEDRNKYDEAIKSFAKTP